MLAAHEWVSAQSTSVIEAQELTDTLYKASRWMGEVECGRSQKTVMEALVPGGVLREP